MYCSKCGSQMEDGQMFCDECGSRAGTRMGGEGVPYRINIRDKSAGVAAILSFFFMGLGQIYVGKIARGLLLMFSYVVLSVITAAATLSVIEVSDWFDSSASVTVADDIAAAGIILIIVMVGYLILWIWNIFDAYKLANKYNDHLVATGNRPW